MLRFLSYITAVLVGGLIVFYSLQFTSHTSPQNSQTVSDTPAFFAPSLVAQKTGDQQVSFPSPTPTPSSPTYQSFVNDKLDFTFAAERSLPSVVHIRSEATVTRRSYDPFAEIFGDDFFNPFSSGPRKQKVEGSGSGVIISSDGYIVTNNHVIDQAEKMEITLNNKQRYTAQLVGTDPSTDIALLKIDAKGLSPMRFDNSDVVKVGQWVVAVGNPFKLASTVTAGIVSAKGRSINILKGDMAIESFIQTDAAVNPGNSGGALVNLEGKLIGINTAIATPTGVYAGYSFAVPSNLVEKIVDDLKRFGRVQRGYLGVQMITLDGKVAEKLNTPITEGVYIGEVYEGAAAAKGGIKSDDIITHIDNRKINSTSQLMAELSRHRPGETVHIKINRQGSILDLKVPLLNSDGEKGLNRSMKTTFNELLGVDLQELTKLEKQRYSFESGVKISKIHRGGNLSNLSDIRDGFVITDINKEPVKTVNDVSDLLNNNEYLTIQGRYPESEQVYRYSFKR